MLALSNEELNSTSNFLCGDFNFPDMNFISVTDNDLEKIMQGERTKTVLVQFENSRDVFVGRTQRKQRNREIDCEFLDCEFLDTCVTRENVWALKVAVGRFTTRGSH